MYRVLPLDLQHQFEHKTPLKYRGEKALGTRCFARIDLSMIELIGGGGGVGHGFSRENYALHSQLGSSVHFFGGEKRSEEKHHVVT